MLCYALQPTNDLTGGTPETQREFIESLSGTEARRNFDRQKTPPVANNFALGYTYYDVLDADQDGSHLKRC